MYNDILTEVVIGGCIEVHKQIGPGLLESTYENCLAHELKLRDVEFKKQHPMPVSYKGTKLDCGYRLDFIIENELIIELKAVEKINNIHKAQLLSYMKLSGIKKGLLINFNVTKLVDGINRFIL